MLNIVLYTPEIPENTGNISRTCVVTGTRLHLIKPLGFELTEKRIKRAGLDYWPYLDLTLYDDFEDFMARKGDGRVWLLSSKASMHYQDASFRDGDYLLFGCETKGVPDSIHERLSDTSLRIPMREADYARCLNLSNSVAVVLYEALRQNDFFEMR